MDSLKGCSLNPGSGCDVISAIVALGRNRYATEDRLVEACKCAPVVGNQIGVNVA